MSNTKSNHIVARSGATNGEPIPAGRSALPLQFFGDRVLIDPIAPDKFLDEKLGIEKPVDFKEPFFKGTVVSVGGAEYGTSIPEDIRVGLDVYYFHQNKLVFTVGEKKYDLVRACDIIGRPDHKFSTDGLPAELPVSESTKSLTE